MSKITIIGAGSVGSTIAYSLTVMGLASEIVMIDINTEKAEGEALDIRQGIPLLSSCTIREGSYADAANSDIVILTSGVARKPGQSRLELAQINVDITKSIIPQITAYAPNAYYIIVSNPVDILTYTFCKLSGLPEKQIIGSGTLLDSARLRSRLAEHFNVAQSDVNAYVLGEHGDSSVFPWSTANIANVPLLKCHDSIINNREPAPAFDFDAIETYVRKSGANVIARKGATFYAVSVSVCHICKCLLGGLDTVMPISTMMHGEYGIDDICLSTLNLVGPGGIRSKVDLPLTDDEIAKLRHSADVLKEVRDNLNI